MPTLTIDGKEISVEERVTLIQAAERAVTIGKAKIEYFRAHPTKSFSLVVK